MYYVSQREYLNQSVYPQTRLTGEPQDWSMMSHRFTFVKPVVQDMFIVDPSVNVPVVAPLGHVKLPLFDGYIGSGESAEYGVVFKHCPLVQRLHIQMAEMDRVRVNSIFNRQIRIP